MNNNILNAVSANIIEFANNAQIDLRSEFGTKDEYVKFVVAMAFKILTEHGGFTVEKAYDSVFGQGTFNELAEATWQAAQ